MTQWQHEVSLEWMQERQKYLTASEVKSLLPVTATGRPRKITDIDRVKVMASKLRTLTIDDCKSTGAAARGHILEPFALAEYNDHLAGTAIEAPRLEHWDDCLVYRIGSDVAFSPDALDIEQFAPLRIEQGPRMTWLGEVKCYGYDRHIVAACTDKLQLEERWQIATAMHVCPSIEHASLILFNPSMQQHMKMFVHEYERADLESEIDVIEEVAREWSLFKNRFEDLFLNVMQVDTFADEGEIIAELVASCSELDPSIKPVRY